MTAPIAVPALQRHPEWLLPVLTDALALWGQETAKRWQRQAAACLRAGWWKAIPTRRGDALYMLRFWLTSPRLKADGDADSGNSVLLHWMARGDDDQALHDHPWQFEAEVLHGGYHEHLPPEDWMAFALPAADGGVTGPAWDANIVVRTPGHFVKHAPGSLHCVGELLDPAVRADGSIDVLRGSWSHVCTETRQEVWGFHPPGLPWVNFEDFLELRRAKPSAVAHG